MPIDISKEPCAIRTPENVRREKFEPFRSTSNDLQDLLSLRLFRTKTTFDLKTNEDKEVTQMIGEHGGYYTQEEIESARGNRSKVTSPRNTVKETTTTADTNENGVIPNTNTTRRSEGGPLPSPRPLMVQIKSHKRIKKENILREHLLQGEQRIKNSASGRENPDDTGPNLDQKLHWMMQHSRHSLKTTYHELVNIDRRIDSWKRLRRNHKAERDKRELGDLPDFTNRHEVIREDSYNENEVNAKPNIASGPGGKRIDISKSSDIDSDAMGTLNLRDRLNAMQQDNTHSFIQSIMPPSPPRRKFSVSRDIRKSNVGILPQQSYDSSNASSKAGGYGIKFPRKPTAFMKPSSTSCRRRATKPASTVEHILSPSPISQEHNTLERVVEVMPLDGEDGAMLHAKISRKRHTEKEVQALKGPKIFSNYEKSLAEVEEDTKKSMEMYERLEKLMAIPARMLRESVREFDSLSTIVKEKIEVSKKGCQKLTSHLIEFTDEVETRRSQLKRDCEVKDFVRYSVSRAKHDALRNLGTSGLKFEESAIKRMRREALRQLYDQKMRNLCEATWFLDFFQKLKSQFRKMLTIPVCCQLFLFTVKQIIEEGITITSDVFYKILEGCITDRDDYKDVFVNKCIKLIREQESCSIDAETFLKYLQGRDIHPSPTLLVQIRQQKRKAKQRENSKKQANARKQMMKDRQSSSQLMSSGSSNLLSAVNSRSYLESNDDDLSSASDSSNLSTIDLIGTGSSKEDLFDINDRRTRASFDPEMDPILESEAITSCLELVTDVYNSSNGQTDVT